MNISEYFFINKTLTEELSRRKKQQKFKDTLAAAKAKGADKFKRNEELRKILALEASEDDLREALKLAEKWEAESITISNVAAESTDVEDNLDLDAQMRKRNCQNFILLAVGRGGYFSKAREINSEEDNEANRIGRFRMFLEMEGHFPWLIYDGETKLTGVTLVETLVRLSKEDFTLVDGAQDEIKSKIGKRAEFDRKAQEDKERGKGGAAKKTASAKVSLSAEIRDKLSNPSASKVSAVKVTEYDRVDFLISRVAEGLPNILEKEKLAFSEFAQTDFTLSALDSALEEERKKIEEAKSERDEIVPEAILLLEKLGKILDSSSEGIGNSIKKRFGWAQEQAKEEDPEYTKAKNLFGGELTAEKFPNFFQRSTDDNTIVVNPKKVTELNQANSQEVDEIALAQDFPTEEKINAALEGLNAVIKKVKSRVGGKKWDSNIFSSFPVVAFQSKYKTIAKILGFKTEEEGWEKAITKDEFTVRFSEFFQQSEDGDKVVTIVEKNKERLFSEGYKKQEDCADVKALTAFAQHLNSVAIEANREPEAIIELLKLKPIEDDPILPQSQKIVEELFAILGENSGAFEDFFEITVLEDKKVHSLKAAKRRELFEVARRSADAKSGQQLSLEVKTLLNNVRDKEIKGFLHRLKKGAPAANLLQDPKLKTLNGLFPLQTSNEDKEKILNSGDAIERVLKKVWNKYQDTLAKEASEPVIPVEVDESKRLVTEFVIAMQEIKKFKDDKKGDVAKSYNLSEVRKLFILPNFVELYKESLLYASLNSDYQYIANPVLTAEDVRIYQSFKDLYAFTAQLLQANILLTYAEAETAFKPIETVIISEFDRIRRNQESIPTSEKITACLADPESPLGKSVKTAADRQVSDHKIEFKRLIKQHYPDYESRSDNLTKLTTTAKTLESERASLAKDAKELEQKLTEYFRFNKRNFEEFKNQFSGFLHLRLEGNDLPTEVLSIAQQLTGVAGDLGAVQSARIKELEDKIREMDGRASVIVNGKTREELLGDISALNIEKINIERTLREQSLELTNTKQLLAKREDSTSQGESSLHRPSNRVSRASVVQTYATSEVRTKPIVVCEKTISERLAAFSSQVNLSDFTIKLEAEPKYQAQFSAAKDGSKYYAATFAKGTFDESPVKKNDDGTNKVKGSGIFNDIDMANSNFRACKFIAVDFSKMSFTSFRKIKFVNCNFQECVLPRGVNFTDDQFKGSKLVVSEEFKQVAHKVYEKGKKVDIKKLSSLTEPSTTLKQPYYKLLRGENQHGNGGTTVY